MSAGALAAQAFRDAQARAQAQQASAPGDPFDAILAKHGVGSAAKPDSDPFEAILAKHRTPEPSVIDRLESAGAGAAHMLGSLVNAPFEAFGKMISPAAGADTDAANDPNSLANQRFAARFGHDAPHVEGVTGRERGVAAIETAANVLFPGAAEAASEHIAIPLLSRLATVPGSANAVARLGTIGGEMIAGGAVGGVDAAAQGQDARGIALSAAGGAILPAGFHAGGAAIGAGLRAAGRGYANVAAEMGARAADRLQAEPVAAPVAPTVEAPVPNARAGRMMDALMAERPAGVPLEPAANVEPTPATVRMYHGGAANTEGGPRWFSNDRAYAQAYADKSGGSVWHVDVPEDHPALVNPDGYTAQDAKNVKGYTAELPAEVASRMQPTPPELPPDPVPASVQAQPAHIESAPELAAAQPSEVVQAASAEVPTAAAEPAPAAEAPAANTPAPDAPPAPESYTPTIKFDTARRPGDSRLRPAHELVRTSDDGLLQEYVQQHQQIQTDLPRTVYRVNEGFGAEGQEGSMRAGGTRLTKNGPTEQSKAMTRIAQAQAVQEKIAAEMERRGMSRGDLHDTAMARAAEQADGDAAAQAALQGDAPYFGEPVDTASPAAPTVGPDGTLRDVSGAVLFANPIGPALRHFAQPALRATSGAALGTLYGGFSTDDPKDRLSNMALYGSLGAAVGFGSKLFPDMMSGAGVKLRVGTAAEEAAIANMSSRIDRTGALQKESSKLALGPTVGARMVTRAEKAMQYVANGYSPLDRLGERLRTTTNLPAEQNPAMLTSLVKAGDHTVREHLYGTPVDAQTREPVVGAKNYRDVWKPLADDPEKVARGAAYLVAERIVGRGESAVLGDAGHWHDAVTTAQAGRQDPVLQQLAKDHQAYIDQLGRYAVDSGLWTQPQWAAIANSDALYVPMKRIIDSDLRTGSGGVLGGGSALNVGDGVRAFKGSLRDVADPIKATIEYTAGIIKRADRYRVEASLFDARDAMGEAGNLLLSPDVSKPNAGNLGPAPHVISTAGSPATTADAMRAVVQMGAPLDAVENLTEAFRVAWDEKNPVISRNLPSGGKEFGRIQMPDVANAIAQMNESNVGAGAVRKVADGVLLPMRRALTATATSLRAPFTLGAAVVRYSFDALLRDKYGVNPVDFFRGFGVGYLHAFGQAFGGEGVADVNALMRAGLGGASAYEMPLQSGAATRYIAPSSRLDQARTLVGQSANKGLTLLQAFAHGIDIAPRLAESYAAERALAPKLASGQITPEGMMMERATAARGASVDFGNRGSNPVAREISRYVPFFSASLNAAESLTEAARRDPAKVAKLMGAVGLSSIGAWAWNRFALDDAARERFQDRPATERVAAIEFAARDGSVGFRIPIANDVGMLHTLLTASLDKFHDDDPHSATMLLTGLRRMLPPGVGDLVTGNYLGAAPIPGVQQLIENRVNRRAYGGNAVEPQHLQSLPDAERRFDSTRPTFDAMAAVARKFIPGAQHTSPLQAENFARGLLGNATEIATPLVDKLATRWMGTTAPPPAIPTAGYNRMLDPRYAFQPDAVVGSAESENDYYAQRTAVEQASKFLSTQEASSQPNVGRVMPYLKNGTLNPASTSIVQASDGALKDVRDKEQQIRDAVAIGGPNGMKPDEARRALDNLTLVRQHITRMASSQLRRVGVSP